MARISSCAGAGRGWANNAKISASRSATVTTVVVVGIPTRLAVSVAPQRALSFCRSARWRRWWRWPAVAGSRAHTVCASTPNGTPVALTAKAVCTCSPWCPRPLRGPTPCTVGRAVVSSSVVSCTLSTTSALWVAIRATTLGRAAAAMAAGVTAGWLTNRYAALVAAALPLACGIDACGCWLQWPNTVPSRRFNRASPNSARATSAAHTLAWLIVLVLVPSGRVVSPCLPALSTYG